MAAPLWLLDLAEILFKQRMLLARLTRLPLVGSITNKIFFSGDQMIYIPPDMTIQINMPIQHESIVLPSTVVEHFIRAAGHHFIMNSCLCRSTNDCTTYPASVGCLFMGDGAQRINPKVGRLVSREEALAHVRHTTTLGLVHTIGRSRVDSIFLGTGSPQELLTVCHCCSCCCLWNSLPKFHDQIANTLQSMPGVQVCVNGQCVGCGACTEDICFVDAIRVVDGKAVISEDCHGCARCVEVCPQDAIEVIIDDPCFIEETIQQIQDLVDL